MSTVHGQKLKYLFRAEFSDGSIYDQTQEDQSLTEPLRSAFYDVLQREEDLIKFTLVGEGHEYSVDLRDGHFEVDGVSIDIAEQNFVPLEPLRVVFFREVRQEFEHGGFLNPDVKPIRRYVNRYFIGWQTTIKGKNHQRTIAVT